MSKIEDFNRGLVLETPARLDWRPRVVGLILDNEGFTADLAFEPVFPHCAEGLYEHGDIVLDVRCLIDSAIRPGGYYILTCSCGYAEHAGLEEQVHVAHPDPNHVVWELDIERLAPALAAELKGPGFLRLVFERAAYAASIKRLLTHAQHIAAAPQPLSLCDDQKLVAELLSGTNGHDSVIVDGLEPDFDNSTCMEDLLAATTDIDWTPRPMLAPNSQVEIGLFGPEPCRVTGDHEPGYISHWFTRHAVARAWDDWPVALHWANRSKARERNLPIPEPDAPQNHFTMELSADPTAFHRQGQRFAELLQASLAEGQTSPGTRVIYIKQPNQYLHKQV